MTSFPRADPPNQPTIADLADADAPEGSDAHEGVGFTGVPTVMVFAGADPSGGAGVQADLMTVSAMGAHAISAITCVTVQDTTDVQTVVALDPDLVDDQARQILEDVAADAFKVGLIGSVENVATIAEIVSDYPELPLVVDPVLAAGGGNELASLEIIEAIREMLLPQTTLLTPNSIEARRLAAMGDEDWEDLDLETCAARLIGLGCTYVLITGTHENTTDVVNTLYGEAFDDDGAPREDAIVLVRQDSWTRLPHSYHGSGCTLASSIAALLATGMDVPAAVREAQEYTWNALKHGFRPGMGQHLPDRFFWAKEEDDEPAAAPVRDAGARMHVFAPARA
jgi:hydroxymethylpyrimidine/phosphomethylpyrimidine kinase